MIFRSPGCWVAPGSRPSVLNSTMFTRLPGDTLCRSRCCANRVRPGRLRNGPPGADGFEQYAIWTQSRYLS